MLWSSGGAGLLLRTVCAWVCEEQLPSLLPELPALGPASGCAWLSISLGKMQSEARQSGSLLLFTT